jgi:isoleucyl-tRNA synthetase
MAPFAPFLSETTYQNLAVRHPRGHRESVHLETFPSWDENLIRGDLEEAVAVMENLVMLGRNFRDRIGVKAKIPLKTMTIYHRDAKVLANLKKFESYFSDELNIQTVAYSSDEDSVVQIAAKANFQALGKKLGPKMKPVAAAIQRLTLKDILALEKGATLVVEGETISLADVEIRRSAKAGDEHLSVHQTVSVRIDPSVDAEQRREGLAREVIRKVQQARKNAKFNLDDRIVLNLHCTGEYLEAIEHHQALLCGETLASEFALTPQPRGSHVETVDLDGSTVIIGVAVAK